MPVRSTRVATAPASARNSRGGRSDDPAADDDDVRDDRPTDAGHGGQHILTRPPTRPCWSRRWICACTPTRCPSCRSKRRSTSPLGPAAASIEIATGGQSSRAPPPARRAARRRRPSDARSRTRSARRGLRIAALNCSAWPFHPVRGAAARAAHPGHDPAGRRARGGPGRVDVGLPRRRPRGSTIDWLFYPWPADAVALVERQWADGDPVLAGDRRARGGERRPADRVRAPSAPPRLQRPDPGADAERRRAGHRRQPRPVAPVLAADGPAGGDPGRSARRSTTSISRTPRSWPTRWPWPGVLDQRPFDDPTATGLGLPDDRPGRTVRRSGGRSSPSSAAVGYDGALSIENEDPYQTHVEAVEEAAAFARPLVAGG